MVKFILLNLFVLLGLFSCGKTKTTLAPYLQNILSQDTVLFTCHINSSSICTEEIISIDLIDNEKKDCLELGGEATDSELVCPKEDLVPGYCSCQGTGIYTMNFLKTYYGINQFATPNAQASCLQMTKINPTLKCSWTSKFEMEILTNLNIEAIAPSEDNMPFKTQDEKKQSTPGKPSYIRHALGIH